MGFFAHHDHPAARCVVPSWPSIALALLVAVSFAQSVAAQASPVHPNAESVRPLAVGERIPNSTLRNVSGERVELASLTRDRGALLVFYRGGW